MFSTTTNNIQPRATKMLSSILQNDKVPLACHYGAIGGLAELGPEVIEWNVQTVHNFLWIVE